MTDCATYVYAVARGVEGPFPPGVDSAAVRLVDAGGLLALVSTVPLATFGEEALRRNLEDLGWLEDTARAHHDVVEASAVRGPTAPFRLATVYLSDDRVRELLGERRATLAAALDNVTGRAEWSVKAFAAPGAPAPVEEVAAAGPGAAYLLRRRKERDQRESTERELAERADALHAELSALSVASRRYPLQDPQLSGRDGLMALNAAYLVDDDGARALRARTDVTRDGLLLEATGPWAPYSFAMTEQEATP